MKYTCHRCTLGRWQSSSRRRQREQDQREEERKRKRRKGQASGCWATLTRRGGCVWRVEEEKVFPSESLFTFSPATVTQPWNELFVCDRRNTRPFDLTASTAIEDRKFTGAQWSCHSQRESTQTPNGPDERDRSFISVNASPKPGVDDEGWHTLRQRKLSSWQKQSLSRVAKCSNGKVSMQSAITAHAALGNTCTTDETCHCASGCNSLTEGHLHLVSSPLSQMDIYKKSTRSHLHPGTCFGSCSSSATSDLLVHFHCCDI